MQDKQTRKFTLECGVIEQHIVAGEWLAAQHRTQNLLELLRKKTGKTLVRSRGGGDYE